MATIKHPPPPPPPPPLVGTIFVTVRSALPMQYDPTLSVHAYRSAPEPDVSEDKVKMSSPEETPPDSKYEIDALTSEPLTKPVNV